MADEKGKGPESLGDILSRLFTARGWGRKSERLHLEDAWTKAAGPEIATKTRVGAMKRGVLEIEVATGVLLQELASFHKRRLLEAMKKHLPSVTLKDLKFRAGVWQVARLLAGRASDDEPFVVASASG